MKIVFSHHGIALTESLLKRAERAVVRAAERVPRATGAVVRFAEDGPERRVEIVFSAPLARRFVASASGRYWGPTLNDALARLVRQASKERHTPSRHARTRRLAGRR